MLDITSGKVEELSVRDYVIGAVCAGGRGGEAGRDHGKKK